MREQVVVPCLLSIKSNQSAFATWLDKLNSKLLSRRITSINKVGQGIFCLLTLDLEVA
uniref:Uncharacterized protein n=1 Tax=Physcomitrium patens TaxID=3218 RepID=A0A2K1JDW0_PHYPA|nr:hypothetical protein PHYPA_019987 [Physcomitrium patens]